MEPGEQMGECEIKIDNTRCSTVQQLEVQIRCTYRNVDGS